MAESMESLNNEFKLLVGKQVRLIPIKEIENLQLQLDNLRHRLETLQEDQSTLSTQYIRKLHEYNDIKDFCLFLLGRLAALKEETVASLYPQFDLSPSN